MLILSITAVQTGIGNYVTNRLNKDFGTNINIDKVGLQFNGDVEIKNIYIEQEKRFNNFYQYVILLQKGVDKSREVIEYCRKLWSLNIIIIDTEIKLREKRKMAIEITKTSRLVSISPLYFLILKINP